MKKGWVKEKLSDICKVINGRAYLKPEMLSEGKYRILRVGNLFTNDKWYYSDLELEEDKYCSNDDLLYAWSASFGPHIWKGEKIIYHYHIWKMVCTDKIDKFFLYYWLDSNALKKQAMKNLHGATMNHITKNIIENCIVSYPPLSEQKEIVEYLDSSFAKIDKLKENAAKNLEEAKALFQSALKDALEPKEGWEEKTLKEVANYRRGSFPQPYGNSEWYDGEDSMPFVQVAELQEDSFALIMPTKKRISKLAQPLSVFVPEGIVLVSLQGSIGKVGITQNNCYVDRTVAIFQSYKLPVDSHFFAYQLKERFAIERLKARGTTIKTITKEEFANFTIMLPPLSEQQSIVSFLDSLNEKVNTLQQNYSRICDECDALKQAILKQVFE